MITQCPAIPGEDRLALRLCMAVARHTPSLSAELYRVIDEWRMERNRFQLDKAFSRNGRNKKHRRKETNIMALLDNITRGKENRPPRLFIYGQEGVGKSTIGAAAPNPVFVQTEDGLGEIDTAKFPLAKTLGEVFTYLNALVDEPHEFKTVVLDSADWLERLIWDQVCRDFGVRSIEKADGGYGKGYVHALTYWRQIIGLLNTLRDQRGMIVIVIAHSKVERFEDPENSAYDRYTPRLHKSATSLICEWSDAVFFATKRFRVSKEAGNGFQGERAIASPIGADGGERILRTVGSPACVAKNRYGLPGEIPMSWTALINAFKKTMEVKNAEMQ